MKTCSTCEILKPLSDFGKNSIKPDGLCAACKPCRNARRKAGYYKNRQSNIDAALKWNRENPERHKASQARAYRKNIEKHRAQSKQRYLDNIEAIKGYQKRYRQENPDTQRAHSGLKRGRKRNATPAWLTEDQRFEMYLIYAQASLMTECLGESHHVDHIIPLKHNDFCGLHVPWNLQVLSGVENMSKHNKLLPQYAGWRAPDGRLVFA
jgi:5-methylcytosine-specific restriction endonuclease McrA